MTVQFIKGRDGRITRFKKNKIVNAIKKAVKQVHEEPQIIEDIMVHVDKGLEKFNGAPPTRNQIEELILTSGRMANHGNVSRAYEAYRDNRINVKKTLKLITDGDNSSTDNALLIRSDSAEVQGGLDMDRVKGQLMDEMNLSEDLAKDVVKRVEGMVVDLYDGGNGMRRMNTTTMRELVDIAVGMEGLGNIRRKQALIGTPTSRIEQLLFSKNQENSNIASNNSEAVREALAESILKPWALENVFSPEVQDAHLRGDIHVHDLGYPERVYCSAHSLEYLKKYGLNKAVPNLEAKSKPPKSAAVLNGHVQTFLASKQSDYAGALGFGFVNILYSSLINRPTKVVKGKIDGREISIEKDDLEKLISESVYQTNNSEEEGFFEVKSEKREMREISKKERSQIAQELIYSASQNAFSRGGQTLFIDFNVHATVPKYMKQVPAIGPGGKYMVKLKDDSIEYLDEAPRFHNPEDSDDKRNGDADNSKLEGKLKGGEIVTYGMLEPTAQRFALDLLDVWRKGDKDGRPFHFPKADLHIEDTVFKDYEGPMEISKDNSTSGAALIFDYAAQIASENGSVYFMFDRGEDAVLAQCCRLKEKIENNEMLKHPEKLRFTGFQNVTVNLARCAYKGKDLEGTLKEVDKAMDLSLDAHRQKRAHIQRLLDDPASPLGGAGKPCDDGKPYIELDPATYIFGLIGMNETVECLSGKQLHESEEAFKLGLEINAHMYKRIKEIKDKAGFKCTIEETPAESTTRRFAKVDYHDPEFGETAKKYIKGTEENPYYTNSIHLAPDADVGIIDRIAGQSKFHQMIASGAIVHAWIGENRPSKDTVKGMVQNTHEKTYCSQMCISPTYTECDDCGKIMPGEKTLCTNLECDNSNEETLDESKISSVTRIVGYNSRTKHWNGSQQQINEDRKKAQEHYAGLGEPRDLSWLYNPARENPEKTTVTLYGKNGCLGCEGTEKQIRSKLAKSGLEDQIDFNVYHLDEYNRKELTDAAMYDVPLDVFPTVVVAGPNGQWKKTAKYANKGDLDDKGKQKRSDLVRGAEVFDQIKTISKYESLQEA